VKEKIFRSDTWDVKGSFHDVGVSGKERIVAWYKIDENNRECPFMGERGVQRIALR
jgi:hypothetical protein